METPNVFKLIMVPSLITLAVTLLRLIGELNHWSETLFSRAAGGGGSIIGISWLALIFGIYFAIRVLKTYGAFEKTSRAFGFTLLALAIFIGAQVLFFIGMQGKNLPLILSSCMIAAVGLVVMRPAWPAYWDVLFTYALAARIPVIVIMFFAIRGEWGTHYDVSPPFQDTFTSWFTKFVKIGAIPQFFAWIPFTVVFCGLLGVITAAIMKRSLPTTSGTTRSS